MMKISAINLSIIKNNITSSKTLMIPNGIKATKCFIIIHIKITIIKGIARIPSIKKEIQLNMLVKIALIMYTTYRVPSNKVHKNPKFTN